MKTLSVFTFILFIKISCSSAQTAAFTKDDIHNLIGNWQGTLTYMDYTSGKPFTMPADVDISAIGNSNDLVFFNSFPSESSANSMDTVHISSDGKTINGENVISKHNVNNAFEIITEINGKDGNDDKPALIHHKYTIGKDVFVIVKEVQFNGEKTGSKDMNIITRREKTKIFLS